MLLKLLALFRRDDAAIEEFAELIAADPTMAGKVMAAANSAARHGRGPVRDLPTCLQVLGIETVRTIVISQAIFQAMHSLPLLRRVELGPFWRHALLAAAVARELARRSQAVNEDEAYLAGLLHDIGRLGLLAAAPEFYAEGLAADDGAAQCLAERRWLKVDHAEAGAWLVERWRLSPALADSVRYHHEPLRRLAATDPLIRIVALAHLVAEQAPDAKLVGDAAEMFEMDLGELTELVARSHSKLKVAAQQLGIRIDDSGSPVRSSQAALQLEEEVAPLLFATTVLANQPVSHDLPRFLHELAATARLLFQFSEVFAMLRDEQLRLRWVGSAELHPWREFSLPAEAGTRIGDAIEAGHPVFIDRTADGADLSIAEDQLLRHLSTAQLLVLPITLAAKSEKEAVVGALVCSGDAALIAELAGKPAFLSAFIARAQSSRRRANEQHIDAERQRAEQASRDLASSRDLAHEINNPLAIIQNYLGVLDVKLGTSDALGDDERRDLSGDIAILQQEVARVGRLVQSLASARPATAPVGVDLNRLVADVVRLFRSQAAESGIDLSADLPHGDFHQAVDLALVERDKLEQVLVNLVKNAVEAMSAPQALLDARPEGAQIVIRNNGLINRDGRLWLQLSVRDNGPGMSGEQLAQLFSGRAPEVDLAGDQPARGRGLHIVHALADGMGAAIQCSSSGFGTSFEIFLPCRQAELSDAELQST